MSQISKCPNIMVILTYWEPSGEVSELRYKSLLYLSKFSFLKSTRVLYQGGCRGVQRGIVFKFSLLESAGYCTRVPGYCTRGGYREVQRGIVFSFSLLDSAVRGVQRCSGGEHIFHLFSTPLSRPLLQKHTLPFLPLLHEIKN